MKPEEFAVLNENDSRYKPHVYLDMDGVQCDFFKAWSKIEGVNDYKDIPKPEDSIKRLASQGSEFVYRFFRDELKAAFIQFIPIVERATSETLHKSNCGHQETGNKKRILYTQTGDLVTDRSVSPSGYGDFLISIFDEWVRHDVGQTYVQIFDVALASWFGQPGGLCVFSPTCGKAV